ncbi:MAG: DnaJ domain-containing protein [Leptospirales bacterium]|nr:DnaJ domain-containing protein [Leptospirales bacterium]
MPASATSIFVDHYAVLGVDHAAPTLTIKQAFRRLARICHPDVCGGDGLRFIQVYSAYRTLAVQESRQNFDRLRQLHLLQATARARLAERLPIPATRLRFPYNAAAFARRGLLGRRYHSGDRRRIFNIDCDLELHLKAAELRRPLAVVLPLTVRSICPDCQGSDLDCDACSGRGSYKTCRPTPLHLDGGLAPGQILEIRLDGLRPGPLCHFKKQKLRLKIVVQQ